MTEEEENDVGKILEFLVVFPASQWNETQEIKLTSEFGHEVTLLSAVPKIIELVSKYEEKSVFFHHKLKVKNCVAPAFAGGKKKAKVNIEEQKTKRKEKKSEKKT